MLIFIYDDIICIPMKFVVGLDYRLAFLVSDFIQIYLLDLKFESKPAILRSKE